MSRKRLCVLRSIHTHSLSFSDRTFLNLWTYSLKETCLAATEASSRHTSDSTARGYNITLLATGKGAGGMSAQVGASNPRYGELQRRVSSTWFRCGITEEVGW